MKKYTFFFIIQTFVFQSFSQQFLNQEIEAKIDVILSKLTLDEKIGQTCQITLDAILKTDANGVILEPNQIDENKLNDAILKYHVGSMLNVSSHTLSLDEWHTFLNKIHSYYLAKKSKVPVIYGVDAIHGVNYTKKATLFPQEIGLAATWNPNLVKEFGQVVSYEVKASGIPWNFSPVLDLGRQPLWSRYFETLGEDPYLASIMGKNIINGYQGGNVAYKYNSLACMKHFVGYSYPLSGRDRTPAWIPEKVLKELFLPPFEEAVKNGALTVMINSGDVNGIPGHINHHLITETLKNKWGFIGFAVTDWEDILMLETVHQVAKNQVDAISLAFNAGIDMSMVPNNPMYKDYIVSFKTAVNEGKISMDRLNDAVRRIIRIKLMCDLFEKPLNNPKDYPDFASKKHKEKAYLSASESITLLKNENNILPLDKNKKILVCGPAANSLTIQNGAWTHTWQGVEEKYNTEGANTIYEAFKKQNKNTIYQEGVNLFLEKSWEKSKFTTLNEIKELIDNVDYVIYCVGEMPCTEKPGDIESLNITKEQTEFAKILAEYKKPIITVLVEGRPRIVNEIEKVSSAVIQTYLPGDYGSDALVDIIYGKVNPSGKLPYTYPRFEGVIEHYDHKKSEDRSGKTFGFDAYNPQWEFGHGLSYSNFSYSDFKLDKENYSRNDTVRIEVKVTNTSKIDGKEVVQLYTSDLVASVVPYAKQLKRFEKIDLKANESKLVKFNITINDLMLVNSSNQWVFEEGEFLVSIKDFKKVITIKN